MAGRARLRDHFASSGDDIASTTLLFSAAAGVLISPLFLWLF